MFEGKNVLITGGAGMIGRALTEKMINLKANITIADLHFPLDLKNKVNVDNIIMNMKNDKGNDISLYQCGVSTRNELRNYVETNNC